MKLIAERSEIAYNYLTGMFIIDVVSIVHLEWFIPGAGDATNLLRFLRLGRLYKVIRMLKVTRLIKLSQANTVDFLDYLLECIQLGDNIAWFLKFLASFLLMTHLLCCFWLIIGRYESSDEHHQQMWTGDPDFMVGHPGTIYLTSFYLIITTVTTVGYGDFSGSNNTERIANCFIMFIGTIGFAYASGILTNWIMNEDAASAVSIDKLNRLDRIQAQHHIPAKLYAIVKKSL